MLPLPIMDSRSVRLIQFWMVFFIVTSVMSITYILYSAYKKPLFGVTADIEKENQHLKTDLQKAWNERDSLIHTEGTDRSEFELQVLDSSGQYWLKQGESYLTMEEAQANRNKLSPPLKSRSRIARVFQ